MPNVTTPNTRFCYKQSTCNWTTFLFTTN